MTQLTKTVLTLSLAILCTFSCTKADSPQPSESAPVAAPPKDEPTEHEPLPSRVRLPQSVLAAAKIRVDKVISKALPMTLEVPGEVAPGLINFSDDRPFIGYGHAHCLPELGGNRLELRHQ